tara:strand:- start:2357 stop:3598 length:1242 start_codon:yes stop_codon:yes gene_type:complete
MTKSKNVVSTIVYIYNSYNDPLFQNLVLSYIKSLAKNDLYKFHIITFEQKYYRINNEERKVINDELNKMNIYWYPLIFHTGKFILIKKLYDFFISALVFSQIKLKENASVILSYTNISASFSIILSKIFSMKMIVYSYEPHSFFLVDMGLWSKRSLKYILLSSIEKYAGIKADYILTGTKHMVKQLKIWGAKGKIIRAPTSVNENEFYFRESGRLKTRKLLNIESRCVLLYIGKFGGLYYNKEIPRLFNILRSVNSNLYFLIVTSNSLTEINTLFLDEGISEDDYFLTSKLNYDSIKDYISSSDIGLSAIPPTPSQKFRSPTKVGEYLMCGLPYITCKGVSEDDYFANKYNVGVVLNSFSSFDVNNSLSDFNKILNEDKSVLRARCRRIGIRYRSQSFVVNQLKKIYHDISNI